MDWSIHLWIKNNNDLLKSDLYQCKQQLTFQWQTKENIVLQPTEKETNESEI